MFDTKDVKVGRYTISVIKDDHYITTTLETGNEWDCWMRQDLSIIYEPGTDILDIGGNIGTNSLMFSDFGPVHVFEPIFHEIVTKNVNQNQVWNAVKVHPYGLSSTETETDIYIPKKDGDKTNYGGCSLHPNDVQHSSDAVRIQLKKLDDVYKGKPSVIKIDVEGHELEVLKGALNTIRTHRPAIFIESFDIKTSQIPELFTQLGYRKIIARPDSNWLILP
jgi:FkbM family methyltransferase